MIRRAVRKLFNSIGYDVTRRDSSFTMGGALRRCSSRGISVNTVIDVGASDGRWSELCMEVFPHAQYLLIEANVAHKRGLDSFIRHHPNGEYILAAAGRTCGRIFFESSDLFGGSASDIPGKNSAEIPVTTIDSEVKARGLKPPFLIKLDTHGYEVPIIEGALQTLPDTSLIIVETYNYRLTPSGMRYFEMASYMERLGFSTIEMADLLLRKKDRSLWQMDTFYIPSQSREFENTRFE